MARAHAPIVRETLLNDATLLLLLLVLLYSYYDIVVVLRVYTDASFAN